MNFFLEEEFITSVTIKTVYNKFEGRTELTEDELIEALTYKPSYSICSQDHPEFAKLRNKLEDAGFIETERLWHNGDRVLKEFVLNDYPFAVGDKFCSAAAMGFKLKYYREKGLRF